MRTGMQQLLVGLCLMLLMSWAHAIDRDQAAERAQQLSGGRVLAVEASERNGEPVFVVRVLTPAGEVRVIVMDARSGRVR